MGQPPLNTDGRSNPKPRKPPLFLPSSSSCSTCLSKHLSDTLKIPEHRLGTVERGEILNLSLEKRWLPEPFASTFSLVMLFSHESEHTKLTSLIVCSFLPAITFMWSDQQIQVGTLGRVGLVGRDVGLWLSGKGGMELGKQASLQFMCLKKKDIPYLWITYYFVCEIMHLSMHIVCCWWYTDI